MPTPTPAESSKRKRSADDGGLKAARKPPNLVGPQTIVTVNVTDEGKAAQPFQVHKNYICYYSPFFEAAFNGAFSEGSTQVMDLDDTDPTTFGLFVNWLYTQKVLDADGELPPCTEAINLWILGDKILAPSLQNAAMIAIDQCRVLALERRTWPFSKSILTSVWDKTTEGSKLRAYLVDFMVTHSGPLKSHAQYPPEMLMALVNTLLQDRINYESRMGGPWTSCIKALEMYFVPVEVES